MKWLTEEIATGSYNEVSKKVLDPDAVILDVRDLVDKSGNDVDYVKSRIDEGISILKKNQKLIVCCDYGLSRSNSIAIGIIKKTKNISFLEAFRIARQKIDESSVKVEMLDTVYRALHVNHGLKNSSDKSLKLCITGAGGFLGRNLIEKIGTEVDVFGIQSREIDLLTNVIELDLFVKSHQVNSILHLANPRVFTNTKSLGDTLVMLKNVLDVCRNNNVKLIFLSGWEIYSGYRDEFLSADENLLPNPKGTYGETKWLCELLINQYIRNYGINSVILRSGPVYGAGGEKPKFLYNFIDKSLKGEKIVTHTYLNGDPALDLLYIDDLVTLLKKAIVADFAGEINIGTGILNSTYSIAEIICELNNSKSEISRVSIKDYVGNISMNYSKAKRVYGWTPEVTLKEGLKKIIESYGKSDRKAAAGDLHLG